MKWNDEALASLYKVTTNMTKLVPGILVFDHLGDGLVVTLDHSHWSRGSGIQVVDVSGQGNADHEVAAPEAAELLVLNFVAHHEGRHWLVVLHVPELARLVSGSGKEALVVGAPGDGVDAAGVRVLALGKELGDELRLFPLVEEDLSVEAG